MTPYLHYSESVKTEEFRSPKKLAENINFQGGLKH
jgi:hypothetical protein